MATTFIRGDTFEFSGPVEAKLNGVPQTDLTGWSATSQIRSAGGALIATLDATFLSFAPPIIQIAFPGSTQDWPFGMARIDIEFLTNTGKIASTMACGLRIENDVTRTE